MKRTIRDMFVIGFALFSMFFGAGNVVFPPYLGLQSGREWFIGFLCYYLADIGLALLALFAIQFRGGTDGLTRHIGRIPSKLLMSAIVLCIGPMLAIPRTAATTYEMSVMPLASGVSPVLFSVLFFALILLLCLRESAVVDIVGKILTPLLLTGLLVLIVRGVLDPIGPIPGHTLVDNVPFTGIEAGYQTMDVLAALVFGAMILKSAEDKGHSAPREKALVVSGASIVAGCALLAVYLGLTYLGATMSRFFGPDVDRTYLVIAIVRNLLGPAGVWLFAVVAALACVTTAVALVSSSASYFSKLSGGRFSYTALTVLVCVFSAAASNFGLEQIISIASPILNVVYPPALVLICLSFFDRLIQNDWVFRLAALGALAYSLLELLSGFGFTLPILHAMPLAGLGFGWILPALVCGAAGFLIPRRKS